MSSVSPPAVRHQSLSPSASSNFAARFKSPWRSNHFRPLACASIAALILSGCGGSDGSASTDAVQADTTNPKFESFVSANAQVRSIIEASPYGTKDDDITEEEAERLAAADNAEEEGSEADKADADAGEAVSESETSSNGGATNLVDTLISDMSEMNDHPLKNVDRKYGFSRGPGYVQAGTNSGGANHLLPWFVQFEGEENSASHTRVQMRNLRLFVKSQSTGKWERLIDTDSFSGIQCDQSGNYLHCPQLASVREDGDSASSLPLSNLNLHGWWGGREPIDGWDVAAIVISLEARLAKDSENGIDDRAKAKYLISIGADYYSSLEAVGVSRAKLVTNEWQAFTFTTLNDVGYQEPGGGISESDLRADPPPME
jgi:hypothetical protein